MPNRHGSLAALSRKKINAQVSDRIHCWGTRKTQAKINCEQAQELITALVDQELDQAERSALEAHLEECSGCRLAFEEELALKRKIRQAGERMHAPALLRNRILSDRRIFPEERQPVRQWLENLW